MRSRQLDRPFHGVRSRGLDLSQPWGAARAYAPRLRLRDFYSHVTAARLWDIPLPGHIGADLHVSSLPGTRPPEARGVIGHRSTASAEDTVLLNGLRVSSPARTFRDLASMLTMEQLVIVGDYLVTGNPPRGLPALLELTDLRVPAGGRFTGSARLREAVPWVRVGAYSPPETRVRLALVRHGLPEPALNVELRDEAGRRVARPDLSWARWKVAVEYLGDHHRTDRGQFRRDVLLSNRYGSAQWSVVEATADDLLKLDDLAFAVEQRLRSRGWLPEH